MEWAVEHIAGQGGGRSLRRAGRERVNLGIDYARASDGDSAVYFRIGEVF